jgi:phage terminase small subunit
VEKPGRAQLEFSALTAQFAAAGISELPQGVAELTRREMRFVMGVLEHGQMERAAIEAGYSPDSAGSIASETLRKPKVFAFYRRCVDKVASQAELVMRRIYERSVIFHAKVMEAAQARADAEEWLLASSRQEHGRHGKDVKVFELKRDRAQRDEKHYAALARAEDALLLNALGKLKVAPGDGAAVSAVTDEVREQLAQLARAGVDIGLQPVGVAN